MTSTKGRLRGKKVAVLVADGFEWVELIVPMKALKRAGATVDVISLHHPRYSVSRFAFVVLDAVSLLRSVLTGPERTASRSQDRWSSSTAPH